WRTKRGCTSRNYSDICASSFFRHSSLGIRHWPESPHVGCYKPMNDLKFAVRQLLKNPGFAAVAVLTLALGIGATTAIVSVVRTAVFDPLPVQHPDRFVQLGVVYKERGWDWTQGISRLALRETRQQTNMFSRLAAYELDGLTLQG